MKKEKVGRNPSQIGPPGASRFPSLYPSPPSLTSGPHWCHLSFHRRSGAGVLRGSRGHAAKCRRRSGRPDRSPHRPASSHLPHTPKTAAPSSPLLPNFLPHFSLSMNGETTTINGVKPSATFTSSLASLPSLYK
jgi:hypothetical protein